MTRKRFDISRIAMHRDTKTMSIQTGEYGKELVFFFFSSSSWSSLRQDFR